MRVVNPGGGISSVTATAPITSTGGTTPAIGYTGPGYWTTPSFSTNFSNVFLGGANQTYVAGLPIGYQVRCGHLSFNIGTPDAVNSYDFGVYNSSGTLVANLGAAIYAAGGIKTVAFIQGTVIFNPGLYYFGFTGTGTTLTLSAVANNGGVWVFGFNANVATSSGGVMPASITPPSPASPSDANTSPWLAMTP